MMHVWILPVLVLLYSYSIQEDLNVYSEYKYLYAVRCTPSYITKACTYCNTEQRYEYLYALTTVDNYQVDSGQYLVLEYYSTHF